MKSKHRHIAFIPAREGSQGFKHKNRLFFNLTADFLDTISWFDGVIVSTDDPIVTEYAEKKNYSVHHRAIELSGPAVSIKKVFANVVEGKKLEEDTILWLFYLPILFKNKSDFLGAKQIIEQEEVRSLCSFIPANIHPFNCWKLNGDTNKLEQYIPNNIFRRQDLPEAWMHYHYLCCLKVSELSSLNSELINENTWPIILNRETVDQLIEIDTPEDYKKWKRMRNE